MMVRIRKNIESYWILCTHWMIHPTKPHFLWCSGVPSKPTGKSCVWKDSKEQQQGCHLPWPCCAFTWWGQLPLQSVKAGLAVHTIFGFLKWSSNVNSSIFFNILDSFQINFTKKKSHRNFTSARIKKSRPAKSPPYFSLHWLSLG